MVGLEIATPSIRGVECPARNDTTDMKSWTTQQSKHRQSERQVKLQKHREVKCRSPSAKQSPTSRQQRGMKDIVIRKATKSDFPVIRKLLAELISATDDTEGMDISAADETYNSLLKDASAHSLVAEIKKAPVGFISFTVRQTILHRSASGLIDELVVAEKYRGKGVGRQLVLAAIRECKQLGCCEVEVSTEKTNVEARRFYKHCGFEERGTLFELEL